MVDWHRGWNWMPMIIVLIVGFFMLLGFWPAVTLGENALGPFGLTFNQVAAMMACLLIITLPFLLSVSSKKVWVVVLILLVIAGSIFLFYP